MLNNSREVGILVQDVVEVRHLPVKPHFVVKGTKFVKVEPAHVSLKAYNVLDVFGVLGAEEDVGVVLVHDAELHG